MKATKIQKDLLHQNHVVLRPYKQGKCSNVLKGIMEAKLITNDLSNFQDIFFYRSTSSLRLHKDKTYNEMVFHASAIWKMSYHKITKECIFTIYSGANS